MSKQTSVEWLIEQIIKYELVPKGTNPDNVLFHKAKEIHKQEIIEAYFNGYEYCRLRELDEQDDDFESDYYNQTYGK
jgi:hypothetical protein